MIHISHFGKLLRKITAANRWDQSTLRAEFTHLEAWKRKISNDVSRLLACSETQECDSISLTFCCFDLLHCLSWFAFQKPAALCLWQLNYIDSERSFCTQVVDISFLLLRSNPKQKAHQRRNVKRNLYRDMAREISLFAVVSRPKHAYMSATWGDLAASGWANVRDEGKFTHAECCEKRKSFY